MQNGLSKKELFNVTNDLRVVPILSPTIKIPEENQQSSDTPTKRKRAIEEEGDIKKATNKKQNLSKSPVQSAANMEAKTGQSGNTERQATNGYNSGKLLDTTQDYQPLVNPKDQASHQIRGQQHLTTSNAGTTDFNADRNKLRTKETNKLDSMKDGDTFEIKISLIEGGNMFSLGALYDQHKIKDMLAPAIPKQSYRGLSKIQNKPFLLAKLNSLEADTLLKELTRDEQKLVEGTHGSKLLITHKFPKRYIIKEVGFEINEECLKTDVERHNNIIIEKITRLGRSRVVKIDVLGKQPTRAIKTSPALGPNSTRLLEEYIEKQSYCHNCFSKNHYRSQCETKRCGLCLSTLHTAISCTVSHSEYSCGICLGGHASLKCPQRFAPKRTDSHTSHLQRAEIQIPSDSSSHTIVKAAVPTAITTELDLNSQRGNCTTTQNTGNTATNKMISDLSSQFETLNQENKELHTQMNTMQSSIAQLVKQISTLVNRQ